MPAEPIQGTLNLSETNHVAFDVSGFLGYSLDLNLDSTDAIGSIYIFCQNTNPENDTYSRPYNLKFDVNAGAFPTGGGNYTSQPVDSAYLTSASYCVVFWDRTSGTGTLEIIGSKKVYF